MADERRGRGNQWENLNQEITGSDVVDNPSTDRKIEFRVRENFRGRSGWTVIAQLTDPPSRTPHKPPTPGSTQSNLREYECTKAFPYPHEAMFAFADFLRRMTVEDQGE